MDSIRLDDMWFPGPLRSETLVPEPTIEAEIDAGEISVRAGGCLVGLDMRPTGLVPIPDSVVVVAGLGILARTLGGFDMGYGLPESGATDSLNNLGLRLDVRMDGGVGTGVEALPVALGGLGVNRSGMSLLQEEQDSAGKGYGGDTNGEQLDVELHG